VALCLLYCIVKEIGFGKMGGKDYCCIIIIEVSSDISWVFDSRQHWLWYAYYSNKAYYNNDNKWCINSVFSVSHTITNRL